MSNPDPRLVRAIRQQPAYLQVPLLTTALIESGGRLDAVGDNGQSFGPYQEYSQGRGSGIAPAQRMDPVASTIRAAKEFEVFYQRGARGASLAYRAQRPADQASYIRRYNAAQAQAQAILGQQGAAAPAPSAAGRRAAVPGQAPGGLQLTPESLAAVRQYASQSEADVLQGKAPASAVPVGARLRTTGAPPAARRQVVGEAGSLRGAVANPAETQVVRAAAQQEGTDYSWGGGGPAGPSRGIERGANTVGFDCSGLTEYAWAKVGVKIGSTTYTQIKAGSPVSPANRSAWRQGDLLFPSPGHVQLYAGNGKAWEAPFTGGKVRLVDVRPSYIAVRRPG